MLTHVQSAEAWLKGVGRLPIQLKYVIEGEEEVGSENLGKFLGRQSLAVGLRLRGDQRYVAIRAGPASDHLRAAGHRLLRAAAERTQAGFALRHVRRSGRESGHCAVPHAGRAGRRAGPDHDSRLLRRRAAALARRAARNLPPCRSTSRTSSAKSASMRSGAKPAIPRSSAAGRGPPSTSTAYGAAIRAKGPKRCSPPGPGPNSASGWCPTRIPNRFPRRWTGTCAARARPAFAWN